MLAIATYHVVDCFDKVQTFLSVMEKVGVQDYSPLLHARIANS